MKSPRTAVAANIIAVVGVLAVLLFGAFLTISNTNLERRLEVANENSQKLYQQLITAGLSPVAPATNGLPSTTGDPGPRGLPGRDGIDGVNGFNGATGQAGIGVQGLTGAPGTSITGLEGIAGTAGAAGAIGPTGLTGITGATGPTGAAGLPGKGVASVSCVLETNLTTALRFVFSDFTIQDVPAPCTVI